MKNTKSNSFKCKFCQERFRLSDIDFKTYLAGGWIEPPNICEECIKDSNNRFEDLSFSDADPGL